jgi:hypothetical protein
MQTLFIQNKVGIVKYFLKTVNKADKPLVRLTKKKKGKSLKLLISGMKQGISL